MRTSHTTIRRMIEDKKTLITDPEFFTSAGYKAYLADLAEAASQRYSRPVTVVTDWKHNKKAYVAFTDNRCIHINVGHPMIQSLETREMKNTSIVGLNAHEIGHVMFTDFTVMQAYEDAWTDGVFYPSIPSPKTIEESDALAEIQEALLANDTVTKQELSVIGKNIDNILEDIYIESRMCRVFPGSFRRGIHLNAGLIIKDMPTVAAQIKHGYNGVSVMRNLMLYYARTRQIPKNLLKSTDATAVSYLELLRRCIPYMENAFYITDGSMRFAAANQIILILWQEIKKVIEDCKEKGTSPADDSAHAVGDTAIPRGSDKPVSEDNADTDPAETEPDETSDEECSADGEKLLKILSEVAETKVTEELECKLADELTEESEKIEYSEIHHGVRIRVNRTVHVDDSMTEAYRTVSAPLMALSKRLQKQLEHLLNETQYTGKQTGLIMGRKLQTRDIHRRDGKIFTRNRLPQEEKRLAVALLVDESGSMSADDRIEHAQLAAIVLYEFCRNAGIPVIVYGHSTVNGYSNEDVMMYAYAEFDSVDNKDAYRMMGIQARRNNRDGAALQYVSERLLTRDEETKLCIVLSDGQPYAESYHGSAAIRDMQEVIHSYRNKGITFFAAAIGADKPQIESIYREGYLDITDLTKLPLHLTRLVSHYLK